MAEITLERLAELRALLPVLDDAMCVATATVGAGHRARFAAVRPLIDELPALLDAAARGLQHDRLVAALQQCEAAASEYDQYLARENARVILRDLAAPETPGGRAAIGGGR